MEPALPINSGVSSEAEITLARFPPGVDVLFTAPPYEEAAAHVDEYFMDTTTPRAKPHPNMKIVSPTQGFPYIGLDLSEFIKFSFVDDPDSLQKNLSLLSVDDEAAPSEPLPASVSPLDIMDRINETFRTTHLAVLEGCYHFGATYIVIRYNGECYFIMLSSVLEYY